MAPELDSPTTEIRLQSSGRSDTEPPQSSHAAGSGPVHSGQERETTRRQRHGRTDADDALAFTRKDIQTPAETWTDLEDTGLREARQPPRDRYCGTPLVCVLWSPQTTETGRRGGVGSWGRGTVSVSQDEQIWRRFPRHRDPNGSGLYS